MTLLTINAEQADLLKDAAVLLQNMANEAYRLEHHDNSASFNYTATRIDMSIRMVKVVPA
ncbi:MAG: hypothetical protein WCK39_03085 [Methanomassiliicoccales archaeon]